MDTTSQNKRIHYAVSWDADAAQADNNQGISTIHVTALDITTGRQLWQSEPTKVSFMYQSSIQQVVEGVIYINSVSQQSGLVLAVDAKDGRLLWQYEERQKNLSSMHISNGTVYIHVSPIYPEEGKDELKALRARDGKLLWVYTSKYRVINPPLVVTPEIAYIIEPEITDDNKGKPGSKYQFVTAIEANSGRELWSKKYPKVVEARLSLVATKQSAYVINQVPRLDSSGLINQVESVQALEPESGKQVWSFKMPKNIGLFAVQVSGDTLYLNGQSSYLDPKPKLPASQQQNPMSLIALNAYTGKQLWQREHAYDQITFLPNQEIYGYKGYGEGGYTESGPTKKSICLLDTTTGTDRWCVDTLQPSLFSLSASQEVLIVVEPVQPAPLELSYNLYGLSKKDGTILWKQPWESSAASVVTVTLVTVV